MCHREKLNRCEPLTKYISIWIWLYAQVFSGAAGLFLQLWKQAVPFLSTHPSDQPQSSGPPHNSAVFCSAVWPRKEGGEICGRACFRRVFFCHVREVRADQCRDQGLSRACFAPGREARTVMSESRGDCGETTLYKHVNSGDLPSETKSSNSLRKLVVASRAVTTDQPRYSGRDATFALFQGVWLWQNINFGCLA